MAFTMANLNEVVDNYIYEDEEIDIDVTTPELTAKANAIDSFLDTLPLSKFQHDDLVLLMANYQVEVKKESFLKGFDIGLKVAMENTPKGDIQ